MTKISALPAAGALTGAEAIPTAQAGTTARTTPAALKANVGWDVNWRAALAASGSALARLAVVGDSVGRGFFATILDGPSATSWYGLVANALQATYGDGGSGIICLKDDGGARTIGGYRVTRAGTFDDAGAILAGPSMGGTLMMSGADAVATVVVRGTQVRIFWVGAAGFGTFNYTIDGGSPVSVNTAGSGTGSFVTTITGLSSGNHTVVLSVSSLGTGIHLSAVDGRNATGVVVDNYSQSALSTGSVSNINTYGAMTRWMGGRDNPADLLIHAHGLNDENVGVTGDQFAANIVKHLNDVKEGALSGRTDLLFMLNHKGPAWGSVGLKYQDYARAYRGLADMYGGEFLNLFARFRGSWEYANGLGFWNVGTDQAHPSDAGMLLIKNQLYPLLTGSIPALP